VGAAAGQRDQIRRRLQARFPCALAGQGKIPVDYGSAPPAKAGPECPFKLQFEIEATAPLPPLIHIVDDDAQARAAAGAMLCGQGFETRLHASGAEFLATPTIEGTCVLLELGLGGVTAEAVQRELARRCNAIPVVAISGGGDLDAAVAAMKLGAVEVLRKPLAEAPLATAVRRAVRLVEDEAGRRSAQAAAAERIARLSPRERQVLEGLLGGLSNKAMARVLGLSPRTVEMHRANMMADLGLSSLPEALRLAIDAGLEPLQGAGFRPSLPGPGRPRGAGGRREHEEELRLILEASSDGAWDWDLRSGQIRLSTALVDRLGYVPEAVPERLDGYERLLHPHDRPAFRAAIEAHLAGETEAYACTYRIRARSGEWRWTEVRGRVVERDPAGGRPLRMIGTANDITERRESEEKARESSALVALVQSAVGAGIWNLNVETRRLDLCARSRELHDLPADADLDLDRWAKQVEPSDLPPVLEALDRTIAAGGWFRTEFRVRRSDGGCRWILGLGQLVVGEGGERRLVGLNQDITGERIAAAG